MSYSYDSRLTTDRDKLRFYVQDTVSGAGPKPADGNFSNEELDGLIAAEGSWQKATAAAFETLAAAWRRYPSFQADGLRLDRTAIADGYAKQGREWRMKHGSGGGGAGSRATIRQDGYTTDVDNVTQ